MDMNALAVHLQSIECVVLRQGLADRVERGGGEPVHFEVNPCGRFAFEVGQLGGFDVMIDTCIAEVKRPLVLGLQVVYLHVDEFRGQFDFGGSETQFVNGIVVGKKRVADVITEVTALGREAIDGDVKRGGGAMQPEL